MALLHGSFYSEQLKFQTHFNAVLPFDSNRSNPEPAKLMILLHGMMDGCDSWLTNVPIHSYAAEHNIFVFIPEGQRSFYTDMEHGGKYHSFLTEELPVCLNSMFGISWNRDKTIIAGNSMGGFGALYTALSRPDLFSRCAAFSPVVNPLKSLELIPHDYQIPGEAPAVFPDIKSLPPSLDLTRLAEKLSDPLSLYLACGRDDFLLEQSQGFHKTLDQLCVTHEFTLGEGEHNWTYWREAIKKFFDSLNK